jgi:IS1 family transposase
VLLMNKLPAAKRAQILGMLCEGMSMRATSRLADVSINTVTKLLIDVGNAASEFQNNAFVNLPCKRVQVDEIWSFVGAKNKNATTEQKAAGTAGDVWTWTAICADTKIIPSWMIGSRDSYTACVFMEDLAKRLANRVQLTSDGYKVYMTAVERAFDWSVDYAMLNKHYGPSAETGNQRRYSPAEFAGTSVHVVSGQPDKKHISTSYAERSNLTLRMGCRRFTRLTNAFSKKVENHAIAVSLHMMHYNFARIHKTLRVTPAMQAGVADHVWSLEEIAELAK